MQTCKQDMEILWPVISMSVLEFCWVSGIARAFLVKAKIRIRKKMKKNECHQENEERLSTCSSCPPGSWRLAKALCWAAQPLNLHFRYRDHFKVLFYCILVFYCWYYIFLFQRNLLTKPSNLYLWYLQSN